MKHLFSIGTLAAVFITASACKKVAGEGGSSSISGVVHAEKYDGAGNLLTEYDAPEEDVYIVYGGAPDKETTNYMYDNDQKTSYGGNFRFDYLEVGSYSIFVYEKCNSCPSGKSIVFTDVEITEKKQEILLDTIIVKK
jgi:hypothetical protein